MADLKSRARVVLAVDLEQRSLGLNGPGSRYVEILLKSSD